MAKLYFYHNVHTTCINTRTSSNNSIVYMTMLTFNPTFPNRESFIFTHDLLSVINEH